MNFAQLEYPIFLSLIIALLAVTRSLALRKWLVLLASLYFYAYWDYRFLGLLLFSTLWDWALALQIARYQSVRIKRFLLSLSLLGNLGLLGFFKYYDFFIESAQAVFSQWGLHSGTLEIVLPIGISFYTFQTLSYSIDVYRGHLQPTRNLIDFSIYVMFFPQLVAGPIVRACEFLPQLNHAPCVRRSNLYPGLALILKGAVKKVLIADHLGMMVDPVFASPQLFSSFTVTLAILAYAGQIYGDFSGYSDIAIGSARLMGFSLPDNFAYPYLATSLSDFWRRWHITLSTWLRDYLYIPLGGSRHGEWNTYRNLMITMVLGGLWHGAAWNFVLWGTWHGLALSLERAGRATAIGAHLASGWTRLRWASTLSVVLVGWMLFRVESMGHFGSLLAGLTNGWTGVTWLPPFPLMALGLLVAQHIIWASPFRRLTSLEPHYWYTPWLVGLALAALALFAPSQPQPFVYFQF
jgi:alginate O-acetyltransferase complex protein AlgI